jgi:hypothetical protein
MVYMRLQEFMEKATACFAKYDIDGTGEVSAWDIKVRLQKARIFDCMHASHPAYLQHTYTYRHTHTIPTHTQHTYTYRHTHTNIYTHL